LGIEFVKLNLLSKQKSDDFFMSVRRPKSSKLPVCGEGMQSELFLEYTVPSSGMQEKPIRVFLVVK
jgi:hypothetical protein